MTTSNYITFILLGVIGLVFLIDFILNSRKKPLEKSVEKFVEEEKAKKKSWFNLKSLFWVYPLAVIVSQILFFSANPDYLERLMEDPIQSSDQPMSYALISVFFLSIFHLLWFLNSRYDNCILKRKKNITLSILIISFLKILYHYFLQSNNPNESFAYHFNLVYTHREELFIPVTIVFLIVVWFFNDKIKAR